jgi:hypothetical protein
MNARCDADRDASSHRAAVMTVAGATARLSITFAMLLAL